MRKLLLTALVAMISLAPVATVAAQEGEMPTPAAELAKFKPLIGSWSGTGKATMAPGAPEMTWTSASTYKWVLADHFVQEDTKVTFAGGAMPAMIFRTFWGWDRNENKYVSYSIGNSGEMQAAATVAWTGSTLVSFSAMVEETGPSFHRSAVTVTGDSAKFNVQVANGAGPFNTMVEGELKKAESGYAISDAELKASMPGFAPEVSAEMKKIASICGSYSMKGNMVPAPGAPPMDISAKESIQPIFGGAILEMRVHGDPIGGEDGFRYEGLVFLGWNAKSGCYDEMYMNNVGDTMSMELRWVDDKHLVSMQAGLQYGTPVASQASVRLDESGSIVAATIDRMNNGSKAIRAFSGEYKKNVQ